MTEGQFQFIQWRVDEGGAVAQLILNRPPLNVLHIPMLEEMDQALASGQQEPALKVVVCRAGRECRAFSAGVDVADHTAERVKTMIPTFHRVCLALAELPVPTVAVVEGPALGGGCELAMACDLVVAAEEATFGQPEIKLAALAPVASVLLPGIIGAKRAADWLFTGRVLTARQAAEAGLVTHLATSRELEGAVETLVGELVGLSGAALRLAKRALRAGADLEKRLLVQERLYLEELMATADVHEGLAAFMARREPQWQNR